MDKMHNYGLARFDKESGKINTSMTAIGRGVIQLWALQNTRENEACVIVDVDERMVFAEYVGADDGLPDVRKNPEDFEYELPNELYDIFEKEVAKRLDER